MVVPMEIDNSPKVFTRPISRPAPVDFGGQSEESLMDEELELPVDLARRGQSLIVLTPMVGVTADDVSITVNQDILFIHKSARPQAEKVDNYYVRECHWGPIAREVHLPLPVDPNGTQASLKDGILRISLPIIKQTGRTKVIKIR